MGLGHRVFIGGRPRSTDRHPPFAYQVSPAPPEQHRPSRNTVHAPRRRGCAGDPTGARRVIPDGAQCPPFAGEPVRPGPRQRSTTATRSAKCRLGRPPSPPSLSAVRSNDPGDRAPSPFKIPVAALGPGNQCARNGLAPAAVSDVTGIAKCAATRPNRRGVQQRGPSANRLIHADARRPIAAISARNTHPPRPDATAIIKPPRG